ncbi:hypothetical protein BCF46_0900 [Litoreibacter meonggei]|uniref:Uncharacterized protein n=1 Tax=Litoreibacter meonggei TaxID=1049199 RepID=A0A497X5Z0_9RHOB|nr:hypothetical protein [Litoreibacter meonggei]RLJ60697.1 hypothetical protein BCF46_0900 [Litoreibacter meonggei]
MTDTNPINSIAALATMTILSAAIAAGFTPQNMGLFGLTPPDFSDPDAIGLEVSLGLSAFTAWASVMLLIPAYVAVWFRNRSARAWQAWMAFWPIDLWLARRPETTPVIVQCVVLHIGALVLLFGGSAFKGELGAIRSIGYALLVAPLVGLAKWVISRRASE